MLFSVSLASKPSNKGFISVSLQPGVIRTGLANSMGENRLASLGKNSLLTTDLDDDKRLQLQCIAFKGIAYFGLMIGLVSSKSLAQGIATHVFAAFHDSITTDRQYIIWPNLE
jgi:hypothetical protein